MNIRTRVSLATRLFTAVLCLCILAVSGGCSRNPSQQVPDGGDKRFLDKQAWESEYRRAASVLTLPPGIVFPSSPESGGAKSFEAGSGTAQAQAYWIHAWEREWLSQRNQDPTREAVAFGVLKNDVPACAFMTTYLDEAGRRLYGEYLRKAELGDPSGFEQDVSANPCVLKMAGE